MTIKEFDQSGTHVVCQDIDGFVDKVAEIQRSCPRILPRCPRPRSLRSCHHNVDSGDVLLNLSPQVFFVPGPGGILPLKDYSEGFQLPRFILSCTIKLETKTLLRSPRMLHGLSKGRIVLMVSPWVLCVTGSHGDSNPYFQHRTGARSTLSRVDLDNGSSFCGNLVHCS